VPALIDTLRRDHASMESLLQVLEQEIAVFDRAGRPDFDLLADILDYFRSFPAQCHRPKEELLLAQLKARDPGRAVAARDIEVEHGQAAWRLESIARLVDVVVNEGKIERTALDADVRAFIGHQRRHMDLEERVVLAAAVASLAAEDWANLDARLADSGSPVCDREAEARFDRLRQRIARWGREDQADRAWLSQGR
jgi:hemerythrin-like domain-containing protein